jgi:hypothetical protein
MKEENWEKEFDKKFPPDKWVKEVFYTRLDTMLSYGHNDIKSFIRQLLIQERQDNLKAVNAAMDTLEQVRQEERERIIKKIKKANLNMERENWKKLVKVLPELLN